MGEADFQSKFSSLYTGIRTEITFSYVYTPLFCLRRSVIALMVVLANPYVQFNLIVYIALELSALAIFFTVKPMRDRLLNCSGVMNEGLIFATVYFMLAFTNYNPDVTLRYALGFGLTQCIILTLAINLGLMLYTVCHGVHQARLKWIYDKAWATHAGKL